ncbi:MAG: lipopolysaccharide biosynthesis protein [Sulfuricaulis sp.]|uniref:lipopolysaccharide biosynthesis protein n=1 Tax=Sulfuricaulis sp. TaxID=2003553 RepID=UPI0034A22968
MPSRKRLLGDTSWVFAGQLASALGTLVGLRLVTEVVPPAVYGAVVLAIGIVGLAQGFAVSPLMQTVLRFYPEYARGTEEAVLRWTIVDELRKPVLWLCVILLLALGAWSHYVLDGFALGPLCAGLFLVEVVRSVEVTFLNASQKQRAMALFVSADAWLRPVAAVAAVWLLGVDTGSVVAGYIAGAVLSLAGFYGLTRATGVRRSHTSRQSDDKADRKRLWAYAKPLVFLPLVGWIIGQSDRYIVGGLAGLELAGIYAAFYGLASRPFLMFTSGVELAVRQVYYAEVTAGNCIGERRVFWLWLASVAGAALLLLLVIVLLHQELATLLLAAQYRAHSALMIWVAMGYVLASCTQVIERICYALHDTRGVLLIATGGAVSSVVIALPMVHYFGIDGAAWAVPIYFGLQLVLASWRARFARQRSASKAALTDSVQLAGAQDV